MTDARRYCEHDERADSCGYDSCLAERTGYDARVWKTRGSAFHHKPTCYKIGEGQRKAARSGKDTHDATRVGLSEAPATLGPCAACYPTGLPVGARRCRTGIDGKIIDAFLVEVVDSPGRSPLGKVNYLDHGERAERLVRMDSVLFD